MDEAVRRVAALPPGAVVGIDGLPVAGKSTLADRLVGELGFAGIFLDDFVRPEADWPAGRQPAFPFPYIRYDDFVATVKAMALRRTATFSPYDWTAGKLAEPRTVTFGRGVVIEGVSALLPDLSPLYSLSIFVESDRPTVLAAARFRGVGNWDAEWREWFLPSADLYFATNPASRADLVVPGRGAPPIG
jgi:uridine kinase